MKIFLLKFCLFAAIWLSLAYTLQWLTDKGLKQSDSTTENKEWYDITNSKINADIIIQGSSKAFKQFSPAAFEKSFNRSTYNLGMEGQVFPMQKWRSEVYLRYNKKPKYIIQVLGLTELSNPPVNYIYLQFIPYLNEGYIEKFGSNGYLNYKDFYIPLYKYTHKTGMIEAGLTSLVKPKMLSGKYKGFYPSNHPWSDTAFLNVKKAHPKGIHATINKIAYKDFIDQIVYCKKNNITLILVYPPTHNSFQHYVKNGDEIMSFYHRTAKKHGVKLLDYSRDAMCNDTSVFYNFNHLNFKGVSVFNKKLIGDLKGVIN